MSKGEQWS